MCFTNIVFINELQEESCLITDLHILGVIGDRYSSNLTESGTRVMFSGTWLQSKALFFSQLTSSKAVRRLGLLRDRKTLE